MPKVKTITLDGTETAVKFEKGYPYYVITNMGDGELYASGNSGITAYADGVYTILPGMETRISPELSADTVFLLGSGMVQVRAEEIAVPTSFNSSGKGGGSGGITDYSLIDNKPAIGGETVDGNKTLHDYGLPEIVGSITANTDSNSLATTGAINDLIANIPTSDFDGQYESLCNRPIKSYQSGSLISGGYWTRACTITNVPTAASCIIEIELKSQFIELTWAPMASVIGVLSYGFYKDKPYASFKVLNTSRNDDTENITGIRFAITNTQREQHRTIHIDFFYNGTYGLYGVFNIQVNPLLWKDSTLTSLFQQNPPAIPSTFSVFTFDNKMETVDSALSETSENPVQNKVVAAAINELSQRISQLEQKE